MRDAEDMTNPPLTDNGRDGTIRAPDMPGALVDRGIGFQAIGFSLVLLSSLIILELLEGANFWLYQWYDRAATELYWSSVVPLAALFDWIRKMFERGKAIREAKKAELENKALQRGLERGLEHGMKRGREEATERFRAVLQRNGITLPPEIEAQVFGDSAKPGF